jgi:NAD(P)-dependent dehydrogenase (short-subunit alcohol dehydrogenase family)
MILANKVAVVTGGARGIGEGIAARFSEAGASLVVADKNVEGAELVAKALAESGSPSISVAVDVGDSEQVDELMEATRDTFGQLDILVNNAAHAHYDFSVDLSEEDWDYTIDVCLKGYFLCAQRAARQMMQQDGGKIINVSSVAARTGLARTVAYAASKGGVEAMTRVMAVELADYSIQVNAIAPGFVDTEFSREVVSEEGRAQRLSRTPARRLGSAEDIAGAALYLASPDSDWVTGSVIVVDGGYLSAGAVEHRRT